MFRAWDGVIQNLLCGGIRRLSGRHRVALTWLFGSETGMGSMGRSPRLLLAIAFSILLHLMLIIRFGNLSSLGATQHNMMLQATLVTRVSPDVSQIDDTGSGKAVSKWQAANEPKETPRLSASRSILRSPVTPNSAQKAVMPPTEPAETPPRPRDEAQQRSQESSVAKEVVRDLTPARSASVDARSERQQAKTSDLLNGISFPQFTTPLRFVEIGFEYYSGLNEAKAGIGRGSHKYEADQAGNFRLNAEEMASAQSTKDRKWSLSISGKVYGHGLFPIGFSSKGALSDRLLADKGSASSLDGKGAGRSGKMPDGVPDRQTLLYYFMVRQPTLPEGKMSISDGEDSAVYRYVLSDVESFQLEGFGEVRAIKLTFSSERRSDIVELWLAPTLHFLPLKARFTDKDGKVLEQQAVSMKFE